MMKFVEILRESRIGHALAVALCSALLLVACGGGDSGSDDQSDLEGTYFYKMRENGEGMTVELRANGLAIGTVPGMSPKEGNYFAEGDKVTVRLQGRADDLVYTVQDDGNLLTHFSGDAAVYVKQ